MSAELNPQSEAEQFVRGLAAALPEAFGDVDLVEEYDGLVDPDIAQAMMFPPPEGGHYWRKTTAAADAIIWLSENALSLDVRAGRTTVLPGGEELLARFFDYIESVLAASETDMLWLADEIYAGITWTEDVIDLLGPESVALLHRARAELPSTHVGTWHPWPPERRDLEPPAPPNE